MKECNYHINEQHLTAFNQRLEEGLNPFFNTWYPALCLFASRFTGDRSLGEDFVQEAFVRLWSHHGSFESVQAMKSFLYCVIRNSCLNHIRSRKKNSCLYLEVVTILESEQNKEDEIIHAEVIAILHAALNELPPACREIFMKYFLEGKGYAEIAKELNLSVSTVRNQKARGLSLLRKKIPYLYSLLLEIQLILIGQNPNN